MSVILLSHVLARKQCSGVHPRTKLLKKKKIHSDKLVARPGLRISDGAVVGEIKGKGVHTWIGPIHQKHRQVNPSG